MKDTSNRFAVSAAMIIASAVLWGLYGSFVTLLTAMGLSKNALVFLRMFATSVPVGFLILATDLLHGRHQSHQNSDRRRASLHRAGHRDGSVRPSL